MNHYHYYHHQVKTTNNQSTLTWNCLCYPTHKCNYTHVVTSHYLDLARLYQKFPELDSLFVHESTYKDILKVLLCLPPKSKIEISDPQSTSCNTFVSTIKMTDTMTVSFDGNTRDKSVSGALLHGILTLLDPTAPLPSHIRKSISEFNFPKRPYLPSNPKSLFHAPSLLPDNQLMNYQQIYKEFSRDLGVLRSFKLDPESLSPHFSPFSVSQSLALLDVPQPYMQFEKIVSYTGDPIWQVRASTLHVTVLSRGPLLDSTRKIALLHILILAIQGHQPSNLNKRVYNTPFTSEYKRLDATLFSIVSQRNECPPSPPSNPIIAAMPGSFPALPSPIRHDSESPVFTSNDHTPPYSNGSQSPSSVHNHHTPNYTPDYQYTNDFPTKSCVQNYALYANESSNTSHHFSNQNAYSDPFETRWNENDLPESPLQSDPPINRQINQKAIECSAEFKSTKLYQMMEDCLKHVHKHELYIDKVLANRQKFIQDLPASMDESGFNLLRDFDSQFEFGLAQVDTKHQNMLKVAEKKARELELTVCEMFSTVENIRGKQSDN